MSPEEPIAQLIPLLQDAFLQAADGRGLVRIPFLPLLYAYVALESEAGLACLTAAAAARRGRTHRELLAEAVENLSERDAQLVPLDPSQPDEEVFELSASDGLASSRLMLPGWLASMREVLPGEPLCAIPSIDRCLVAGSASDDAVVRLLAAAEVLWEGEQPLSPVLYSTDPEGLVVPWIPPADHPAAGRLQQAHAAFVTRTYERQREVLVAAAAAAEQRGELAEDAPLIAECRVVPAPHGGAMTGTTLVEGIDALLPVTDLVFLAWRPEHAEPHYLLVARTDLQAVAPQRLVRVPDLDPPRLATLGFPNAEELALLREQAIASAPEAASTNPEPRE